MREILEEFKRRKYEKENLCDSCHDSGGDGGYACGDCLGQGILLSRVEYATILEVAGHQEAADDLILSAPLLYDYQ